MPELPEVETIRRDLARALLGKEIVSVQVLKPTMLHNPLVDFLATMQGNAFVAVNRLGKLLNFQLRYGHDLMLLHLKMTGQLIYSVAGGLITGGHPSANMKNLPNQHTRFIWTFDDNSQLYFNDLRTFGYVKLLPKSEWPAVQAQYGPEPLQPNFRLKHFKQSLSRRKISIKSALLNQKIVAGIGNIYADEICFLAGVLPTKPVPDLSEDNLRALHRACKKIIKLAVEKRGTSFSDYVDGSGQKGGFYPYLKVYERAGLKCKNCIHATIKKVKHGGRGTHFCPYCQK